MYLRPARFRSIRQTARFLREDVYKRQTSDGRSYRGILNAEYDNGKKEATGRYVDLGQDSAREIAEMGIRPGDMVTFASGFHEYENGRFAARALDDRAGCFCMGELMKRMAGKVHKNRLSYAFTLSLIHI